MIAAFRCAVHHSNVPSSGSGLAGWYGFLTGHLHFAYWVSSSRGGHFNTMKNLSKQPDGPFGEISCL